MACRGSRARVAEIPRPLIGRCKPISRPFPSSGPGSRRSPKGIIISAKSAWKVNNRGPPDASNTLAARREGQRRAQHRLHRRPARQRTPARPRNSRSRTDCHDRRAALTHTRTALTQNPSICARWEEVGSTRSNPPRPSSPPSPPHSLSCVRILTVTTTCTLPYVSQTDLSNTSSVYPATASSSSLLRVPEPEIRPRVECRVYVSSDDDDRV